MQVRGVAQGIKSEINVTPLIDVVLVLLIIFMVVTPLLERGQSVRLPASKTEDEKHEPDPSVLSMPSDRSLWLDSTPVTKEALAGRLAQMLLENPRQKLVLKADKSLSVGPVREVLAITKAAGIADVSIAVDDEEAR